MATAWSATGSQAIFCGLTDSVNPLRPPLSFFFLLFLVFISKKEKKEGKKKTFFFPLFIPFLFLFWLCDLLGKGKGKQNDCFYCEPPTPRPNKQIPSPHCHTLWSCSCWLPPFWCWCCCYLGPNRWWRAPGDKSTEPRFPPVAFYGTVAE